MADKPLKIAYLFGAGATHAELTNIEGYDPDSNGLLIGNVTRRVILKAKADPEFLKSDQIFLERAADHSNIELFISLIENNGHSIENASQAVDKLKEWVEEDVKGVLTAERMGQFILHKALFELHQKNPEEAICGLISLNYDGVLDEAYKEFLGEPDYHFSFTGEHREGPPLLKLHGSFDWDAVKINGRERKVPIIPLGVNKNYLRLPYNFIWGRALEVLTECDILRVVGCSLSTNDINLVDLLFKAHLEKKKAFEIQIISSDNTGDQIRSNYSFLPNIVVASKIENTLLPDASSGGNIFREWLKAKGRRVLKDDATIEQTTYLKQIIL